MRVGGVKRVAEALLQAIGEILSDNEIEAQGATNPNPASRAFRHLEIKFNLIDYLIIYFHLKFAHPIIKFITPMRSPRCSRVRLWVILFGKVIKTKVVELDEKTIMVGSFLNSVLGRQKLCPH
jgi:hypothetical protein